jgi:hypothetical protein
LRLRLPFCDWIDAPVLGLAREDYLGRTDADIFGGEDGARLTALKEEVLRTGLESHAEVTVPMKLYFGQV